MKTIIVKIPVDFQPFLKMADEVMKKPGYEKEDRIKLAMHQSVLHQEEAFEKALDLIEKGEGVNVAVEPIELIQDNTIVVYDARFTIAEQENKLELMRRLLKFITSRNKFNWKIITE